MNGFNSFKDGVGVIASSIVFYKWGMIMNNINLNLYRIYYIVAKSKSLVEASRKLHISQPAISKDIRKLEDALNTKLIYRKNNGISLTADGEEFIKYLDESFGILNTGEEIIKQKNDLEHGTISIGCLSHISSLYLMERIEAFKNKYPGIKIQILSATSEQLMELLQLHKLNFIIDTSMPNTIYNNLETKFLKDFDTIFISNKNMVINDLKELENKRWILPFDYTGTRKRLDKTLEKYNICIKSSMELDVTDLIIDAVKRDLGIGYVIKDAADKDLKDKNIYQINTNINLPKTSIYLINLKGQLTKADKILIKEYLLR